MLGAVCGFGARTKELGYIVNAKMKWLEMTMGKKTYRL